MAVPSDSTLQSLARLASKLALRDDCTIERGSVNNGQAVLTVVDTVKALANIPKQPLGGQSAAYEDYQGNFTTWHVFLPLNTNVQEGDILTIKGQRMEVQKVLRPVSIAVFDEVEASGVKG